MDIFWNHTFRGKNEGKTYDILPVFPVEHASLVLG